MATETRTFGTFADDSAVGTLSWTNPSNAAASDGSKATNNAITGSGQTHYHKSTNSSHSSGSTLASGDTINSITYRYERRNGGNPAADIKDWKLHAVEGGSIVTANNYADTGTTWPTSDTVAEYIQNTNLPSASTILANDWGAVLACENTNATAGASAEIDYVEAIIDFTAGSGGGFLAPLAKVITQSVNRAANYCLSFFRSFSRASLAA